MSKFISLMDKIYSKSKDIETMNKTTAILETTFDKLRGIHPELYEDTMYKFEEMAYDISLDDAEKIVAKMIPYNQKWEYNTIKDYLKTKGIENNCIDYYLVMNMAYNDYYNTAKSVGKEEDADFYFNIAKDFITDEDAEPFKVAKYFL